MRQANDHSSGGVFRPSATGTIVATIPSNVQIPVKNPLRSVSVVEERYDHILSRRLEQGGNRHVELVTRRLADVLSDPSHVGQRTNDPRNVEFFRRFEGDFAGVIVAVKFLPGEAWINTAIPCGDDNLRNYVRTDKLRRVGN